ncbi:uncharacterized protein LOC126965080 [Leptidea sinapis]|uniref:Uncharacterized protein n=1 Tax=Leptidea sinapis TaxID=189913 RepID=A0A5E4QCB5_9NEOP|nr:uncharacterized protein LOC126965080 [Leptidea sinapis]VVC95350.1 unnamed protein product [Leptidea sinapis]
MPAKKGPKSINTKSSFAGEFGEEVVSPRVITFSIELIGEPPGPGDWWLIVIFHEQIVLDTKWSDKKFLHVDYLQIDLKDLFDQNILTDHPVTFVMRLAGGKVSKDHDPLLHSDNRAGGNVDLLPLILGEEKVAVKVPLVFIANGEPTNCFVIVHARSNGIIENARSPLIMTMISAHCLPIAKEGTVYISAIGLNDIHMPKPINFGMSLSSSSASKVVWASISNAGNAARTTVSIPDEDKYIPYDFEPKNYSSCNSVYWNAMKRVLVDLPLLKDCFRKPLMVEVAGVPRTGKIDVRGRYMAFVDAGVMLEPGQLSITTTAKLFFYSEGDLPEHMSPLLDLPPMSAKLSARETDLVQDENGHNAYIVIRFDLFEPLVPQVKIAQLYDTIGFSTPDGPSCPIDDLRVDPPPEDSTIDVRKIRKEGGALAVHKELSGLSCKGTLQMNQSIKRTAANRLLYRVRSMLKQFPPQNCSELTWQDIVTSQHLACRRAVTASFAPHPPTPRPTSRVAAARCRGAGDKEVANEHIKKNLIALKRHPRPLLSKALRDLEENNEIEACNHLLEALSYQRRNRYLLWTLGGLLFDKDTKNTQKAAAAFRVAVKGDITDGLTNAIGWAALHAFHHHNKNFYAAFVSSKKMREAYELPLDWKKLIERWVETSGEEETYWIPSVINISNPFIVASAFFLCLRCFSFVKRLLKCAEGGCAIRGSRLPLKHKNLVDIMYIKAASFLLTREIDEALEITKVGIKTFGPSAIMSEMKATCLTVARGWDGECEESLLEADRAGSEIPAALLLRAALGGIKTNPEGSLQRAARAHKLAPSAYSALIIGRVYLKLEELRQAERWVSVAVKTEPLLADGWAVLALIAMRERNSDKARTMMRTARQVGLISSDIKEDLKKAMKVQHLEGLPELLVKDLCLCKYY